MTLNSSADPAALQELAPSGKLRVGVVVAPTPSASFAIKDAGGNLRGVAISLGTELAKKLGVSVEFVQFPNSGELTEALAGGGCDVAFLPVDDERRQKLAIGAAYNLFESTLLVPAGSNIATLAEANRAGVRVVGIANTTTIRSAIRALKNATVIPARSVDEAVAIIRGAQADALALSRNSLLGLVGQLPGARILDGHFHAASTAVAVPKNRPAALAFASACVEEAKASGLVRRALDEVGLQAATVAPAGAR